MLRILTLAALSLTLTLGCASSDDKKNDAPPPAETQPTMTDQQAIIGTWASGATRVTFNNDGSYNWVEEIPCGSPPCKTRATAGTYQWRSGGKLYLTPNGGQAEVFTKNFGWNPRSLMLNSNKRGQSWNFGYSN